MSILYEITYLLSNSRSPFTSHLFLEPVSRQERLLYQHSFRRFSLSVSLHLSEFFFLREDERDGLVL